MSIETPASRLRDRELTDEEVAEIANYTMPSAYASDLHARSVVPVIDTGDEIEIGSPRTIEGGCRVRWSDDVLGTFGAGGKSEKEVREAFGMFKAQRF